MLQLPVVPVDSYIPTQLVPLGMVLGIFGGDFQAPLESGSKAAALVDETDDFEPPLETLTRG